LKRGRKGPQHLNKGQARGGVTDFSKPKNRGSGKANDERRTLAHSRPKTIRKILFKSLSIFWSHPVESTGGEKDRKTIPCAFLLLKYKCVHVYGLTVCISLRAKECDIATLFLSTLKR